MICRICRGVQRHELPCRNCSVVCEKGNTETDRYLMCMPDILHIRRTKRAARPGRRINNGSCCPDTGCHIGPASGGSTRKVDFYANACFGCDLAGSALRLQLSEVAAAAPRGILAGLTGFIFSMIAMCAFFWLTTEIMQDQMTFPIKSFFFFLIDLEFPTDLRLVVLGAVAVLFLVALRIPAVLLSTRGMDLRRKEFRFPVAALASGLAAGPLATLPLHRGIPGMENLAPGIYAVIVFSVFFLQPGPGAWAICVTGRS